MKKEKTNKGLINKRNEELYIIVFFIISVIATIIFCVPLCIAVMKEKKKKLDKKVTWYKNEENSYTVFLQIEVEDQIEDFNPDSVRKLTDNDALTKNVIKKANKKIIKFFSEYDINIKDKLPQLNDIYIYPVSYEYSETVPYGYVDTNSLRIYIRDDMTNLEIGLESTYVHEVLHFLGATDINALNVTEGITDIIAEKIVGNDYMISEGYIYQRQMAEMLLIANPKFIDIIFNTPEVGENTRVYDEINNRLKDFKVNYFKEVCRENPATILEFSIRLVEQTDGETLDYMFSCIQLQEIIIAYCNACGISSKDVCRVKELFFVPYDWYEIDKEIEEIFIL